MRFRFLNNWKKTFGIRSFGILNVWVTDDGYFGIVILNFGIEWRRAVVIG